MGVTGSRENKENKPVVLIVGGGYGGVGCAKVLDKTGRFFIVLIDRKSYFLHNIGAVRIAVEPDFAEQILIPYDRLLSHGCVVQGEVVSILENSVRIHGHPDPIGFDFLVIATGSSYAFPGKIAEPQRSTAIEIYRDFAEKVRRAEKILIVGGGPVGIEIAGEIATNYPSKQLTLIHKHKSLLTPDLFEESLCQRLQRELENLAVKIILGDQVLLSNVSNSNLIEGKKVLQTENLRITIETDLILLCTGASVNNKSLLNGPLKSKLEIESRRLMVDEFLRVEGFEKIFAIGDVAEKEEKFAHRAGAQGEFVGNYIDQFYQKKNKIKSYEPMSRPAAVVSVGRNAGAAQLPLPGRPVFGNFFVKTLKSKNLFVDRYRSMLNVLSEDEARAAQKQRVESLKSSLSLTDEQIEQFIQGFPIKQIEA